MYLNQVFWLVDALFWRFLIGCYIVVFSLTAVSGNTGASTVSTGLSTGEIAAIVLAVLLLLILIIIIIICCLTHGKSFHHHFLLLPNTYTQYGLTIEKEHWNRTVWIFVSQEWMHLRFYTWQGNFWGCLFMSFFIWASYRTCVWHCNTVLVW